LHGYDITDKVNSQTRKYICPHILIYHQCNS